MKKLAPIAVPWRPIDALVVFFLAWLGAPIAIAYSLKFLAPYNQVLAHFLNSLKDGGLTASFVFAVVSGIISLVIVGLYLQHYSAHWRDVGWRKFNFIKAVLYIILALVFFVVAIEAAFVIVMYLFPSFNANQPQTNEFTSPTTSSARTIGLLALVILPPIIEETVFRGFIFPALSKWGGVFVGAILTSLLFGLAHLQLNVGVYTIVLSLILCTMYYRLRSIWPGVLLHMLNNYIAYMALIKK